MFTSVSLGQVRLKEADGQDGFPALPAHLGWSNVLFEVPGVWGPNGMLRVLPLVHWGDSAVWWSRPDRMVSFHRTGQDTAPVFRVLAFVSVCLCAISVQAQSTHYKWWLARDIETQLHLTPEQVKKIDDIFESTLAERRAQRQELDALDRRLDALLDSATADDVDAAALIARVEAARAHRNTARVVMLYRMRRILTPEQRHWLDMRAKKLDDPRLTPIH